MGIPADLSYQLRNDGFQATVVEALMLGVYTSIVLFTLHKTAARHGAKAFYRPLTLLTLIMYTFVTIHVALRWKLVKRSFVDLGETSDAVFEALTGGALTVSDAILSNFSRGIVMFIADGIMIWRCWRLYGDAGFVVVAFPVLLLFAELGCLIGRIIASVRDSTYLVYAFAIAHSSLTLSTTLIVTLLIVYRIVRMGGFKKYRGIIGILLESSALYAVALIIYIPFPSHPVLFDLIPNAVLVPVAGIASTLIIARVALGKGIEHDVDHEEKDGQNGMGGTKISSLRFQNTMARGRDEETGTDVRSTTMSQDGTPETLTAEKDGSLNGSQRQ